MKNSNQTKTERKTQPNHKANGLRAVHFEIRNPQARKVCLAGTFNNWKPDQAEMVRNGDGKWEKDIPLTSGTYEYRLVVDGQWMPDPNAKQTAMNPFGEQNSVVTVP